MHNTTSDSSRACTEFIYDVLAHLPSDCVSDVSGFTSQAGQVDLEFYKESQCVWPSADSAEKQLTLQTQCLLQNKINES